MTRLWRPGIDPDRAAELSARADLDDVRFGPDRRGNEPRIEVAKRGRCSHLSRGMRAAKVTDQNGNETVYRSVAAAATGLGITPTSLQHALDAKPGEAVTCRGVRVELCERARAKRAA